MNAKMNSLFGLAWERIGPDSREILTSVSGVEKPSDFYNVTFMPSTGEFRLGEILLEGNARLAYLELREEVLKVLFSRQYPSPWEGTIFRSPRGP